MDGPASASPIDEDATGTPIAAVNEATRSIEFYPSPKPGRTWKPTKRWRPISSWGGGVDVKLRPGGPYGGRVLAIADDASGYVAVYTYPGLKRKWSAHAGRGRSANVHGVEFLPDGNVAIADAAGEDGGSIRILSRRGAKVLTRRAFPGAHEVLYDPSLRALWAIGNDRLTKYPYRSGDLGSPVDYKLPRSSAHAASKNVPSFGHDVQPVYGHRDRLWIVTSGGVTQFSKNASRRCRLVPTEVNWPRPHLDGAGRRYCNDFPGAATLNAGNPTPDHTGSYRRFPKSIGNDPATGRVLLTFPAPAPGYHSWTTPYAGLYTPPGWHPVELTPNRTKTAYYRARWLIPAYQ
ncbi:DUF6528 family protein [Actinomadura harenae]|uniref:Uncharacterized protein n=1 Tax=Actinomadura harenae TaxID=2483351 RepID=A0A3M2L6T6_9ACTN|nr:DUF6528 family protein [Actinomadura harenae]RMI32440.1 hypothetical protein EBO15_42095 [Actinomadura harenae]